MKFPIGIMDATRSAALALSFVDSGTSSASTITIPATAQAGDIAVLLQVGRQAGSTIATAVTPTGFTNARNDGLSNAVSSPRAMIDYKVLVGGDPGASITGMNGSASNHKIIIIFRPSAALTGVAVFSAQGDPTTGDPAQQTISVTGQAAPVVLLGQAYGHSGSVVVTGTLQANGTAIQGLSTTTQYGVYEIQNSGLTDRTIDMGDSGNNILQSLGLAFS